MNKKRGYRKRIQNLYKIKMSGSGYDTYSKPLIIRKKVSTNAKTIIKTTVINTDILSVIPVEIIYTKNPIYNQIIKLINDNYDEEIVFKNICRYMQPGSYGIILKSNFGLNDNMIIELLKISAARKKNLLAILIIKYYQQCMFDYNKLIYRDLADICVNNHNKDLLIWIAKSTYNKKISKKIYGMIDRL